LFGDWIPDEWIEEILEVVERFPDLTFQILTKCPARAREFEFPSNVWLGVSVENEDSAWRIDYLRRVCVGVRFVSFEPLLGPVPMNLVVGLDWVIVGFETGSRRGRVTPPPRWVRNIERACIGNNIPLFIKDNVGWTVKVQMFP